MKFVVDENPKNSFQELLLASTGFLRIRRPPFVRFFGIEPSASMNFSIMSIYIATVARGEVAQIYRFEDWIGAIAQLPTDSTAREAA